MAIEKKKDAVLYNSEDEYLMKALVSSLKQGTLDKNMQEQLNILCDSIKEMIYKEYPIRTVSQAFGMNQMYRNLLTIYCINRLGSSIINDYNKNVTDSDDKER